MRKLSNLRLLVAGILVATLFVGCKDVKKIADDKDPWLNAEVQGLCVIKTEVDEPSSLITYYVPMYTPKAEFAKCKLVVSPMNGNLSPESENVDLTNEEAKITVIGNKSKEYTVKRAIMNVDNATEPIVNKYAGNWTVNVNGEAKEYNNIPAPILFIEHSASNTVKMTIDRFKFEDVSLLSFTVENIYLYDKKDSIAISGVAKKNVRIAGVKTDVVIDICGAYYPTENRVKLSIAVSGVEGKEIITTFDGNVYSAPTDVTPLFAALSGSKVLSQTFTAGSLTFYADINNKPEDYKDITLSVKVPEGADWKNPGTGTKECDFSQPTTMIIVYSKENEDLYEAFMVKKIEIDPNFPTVFNFMEWKEFKQNNSVTSYFNPEGWETSNQAVATIKSMNDALYPKDGEYPVTPIDGGYVGKGVKIMTVNTVGGTIMGIQSPKVTSGTIYLGSFDLMAAMKDPLLATKFGVSYSGKQPASLTGWYKYTPGTVYYDGLQEVSGTVDAPSISVVLYDVSDDMKVSLTGVDIFDSPRIVAKGVAYPTKSVDFKQFSVRITLLGGKTYTPATNKYKLAIILSSSKDGAAFKGAPGSTFIVDEMELK